MGVTGKRVQKSGIGGRARTIAGAGPTDLRYSLGLYGHPNPKYVHLSSTTMVRSICLQVILITCTRYLTLNYVLLANIPIFPLFRLLQLLPR